MGAGRCRRLHALVAATALRFDADVWLDYVRLVVPQQRWILDQADAFGWSTVASAYVNARLVGLPDAAAWGGSGGKLGRRPGHGGVGVWRRRDAVLANVLFVTATFLFSPWTLTYDLVVFGWVIALLRQRSDGTAIDQGLIIALWVLPVAMLALAPLHYSDRHAGVAGRCRPVGLAAVAKAGWRTPAHMLWRRPPAPSPRSRRQVWRPIKLRISQYYLAAA